jgi:hypothetical protein
MPLSTAKQALTELAREWTGALPRNPARTEAELAELALYLIHLAGECGVDLAYVTNKRLHRGPAGKTAQAPRERCSSNVRHSRH